MLMPKVKIFIMQNVPFQNNELFNWMITIDALLFSLYMLCCGWKRWA